VGVLQDHFVIGAGFQGRSGVDPHPLVIDSSSFDVKAFVFPLPLDVF